MRAEPLVTYRLVDGVAEIMLTGPRSNALASRLIADLAEAAGRIERERPRCVVLGAEGRTFCAGADLGELSTMDRESFAVWNEQLASVLDAWAALPVPVVVALTGHALGGGLELALTADRRVAAEGARIGLPEVRLGIVPGAGGTHRLAALVGRSRSSWLIMTGLVLVAEDALEEGLVDEVCADPLTRAREIASEVAGLPTEAVLAAKRLMRTPHDPGHPRDVQQTIGTLFDTPEREERFAGFLTATARQGA
jgi:enoyl-CoA hydratase/carnithine racemase